MVFFDDVMFLRSHWSEIVEHVPRPGRSWRWVDCELSHRTKYRLKDAELIVPAPREGEWETTRELYEYVDKKSDGDDPVGEAIGQELISQIDPRNEATRRVD